MDKEEIEQFFGNRRKQLESVRAFIYPAFYDSVLEKINKEEQSLLEIFNFKKRQEKILQQYTFVLDRAYFDQKFLPRN